MLTLHPTDKHEVVRTKDQAALAEAARTARALRGVGVDCSAAAMLVLAAQRFPDDDLALAAQKLTAEFEAFRAQIKPIAAVAEKARAAESQRVAPWIGPAINRQGEIKQKIEFMRKRVEAIGARKSNPSSQERDMRIRGVSAAEIDRVIGCDADIDGLLAQIAGLKAEQGKIDLFFKTEDLAVLPESVHPYKRSPAQPPVMDSDVRSMIENTPIGG